MSKFEGSIQCPCCKKKIAPRSIHVHTSSCEEWKLEYGEPIPYFKYDPFAAHRKPLYEEGAVEGVDFVKCMVCWQYGWDFRFSRLASHIKKHGMTEEEYEARYPEAKVRLEKTTKKRVATTREKYGVDNVSQSDEVKARMVETFQENYGVDGYGKSKEAFRTGAVPLWEVRYGFSFRFKPGEDPLDPENPKEYFRANLPKELRDSAFYSYQNRIYGDIMIVDKDSGIVTDSYGDVEVFLLKTAEREEKSEKAGADAHDGVVVVDRETDL